MSHKLWSMQSSLKLFGTTPDVATGQWIEYSSGIGAGRYHEADIRTGRATYWKLTSLQAFCPGLQASS
ncbi:hypothetical protein ACSQ67_021009 [Phaseolus vulgaris]